MTPESTPSPWTSMAMFSLAILWIALVYAQKSRIVSKYEQNPALYHTRAIENAMRLLRHFGPGVRAVYYSTHLSFVLAMPAAVLSMLPGYRDLGTRRSVLSNFSLFDRLLAVASTLVGITLLAFILFDGPGAR